MPVGVTVYFADGLDAHNIAEAVKNNPYGIDFCSGVRTNNKLYENKLKDFLKSSLIT